MASSQAEVTEALDCSRGDRLGELSAAEHGNVVGGLAEGEEDGEVVVLGGGEHGESQGGEDGEVEWCHSDWTGDTGCVGIGGKYKVI